METEKKIGDGEQFLHRHGLSLVARRIGKRRVVTIVPGMTKEAPQGVPPPGKLAGTAPAILPRRSCMGNGRRFAYHVAEHGRGFRRLPRLPHPVCFLVSD